MNLPILYKYTNGQLRQWSVWVEEEDCPIIVVEHGLVNGKKQIKETFIEEGKNYGKSNATTAIEQAESEAASKWRKQIDKGYCEKDKLGSSEFYFRPMLAHRFDQHGHKIKYPAYIQAKLDGCLSGDSLIKTKEYGYKTIKWIVDNEIKCKVLSYNN